MILILILVLLDVFIKGFVYFKFLDVDIKFLNGWIGFAPMINRKQASIFNLGLDMGIGTLALIFINMAFLIGLGFIYHRLLKLGILNAHIKVFISLFISGSICSIIDKLVLGGSLDYILIKKFVCDLKDIYLFMALIYLITYILKTGSLTKTNDIQLIKKILGINK